MSEIEIFNPATNAKKSLSVAGAQTLADVRQRLGAFMKKDDVFAVSDELELSVDLEARLTMERLSEGGRLPKLEIRKPETHARPEPPEPEDDDPLEGEPDPDPEAYARLGMNEQIFGSGSLKPIELPEHEWADDRVGLLDGLLKDGRPVKPDSITEMTVGQVRNLLKGIAIDLNHPDQGLATAFIDDDHLGHAPYTSIRVAEVEVKPPDFDRITSISFQYDEHVSRLHRTTTTEGDAAVGIPGIFRARSAYRYASAVRSDQRVVAKHKSFSHLIPKARIVCKDDGITLSDDFVGAIRAAVATGSNDVRAEKLLEVLAKHGQFVGSDVLVGGRLDYWTDERLEESYDASADETAFRVAVTARATVDGVPVEGSAGWGLGLTEQQRNVVLRQAKSLHHKTVGGSEAVASPELWIPTVAKYLNWKVIGFHNGSLVPTIEYLRDAELYSTCLKILRRYFSSHLQLRSTGVVGPTRATAFGQDLSDIKRIVKIDVNHGINIDGLRVTYELLNGQLKQMPEVGGFRGEHTSTVGPLAFDETIVKVEVGANDLMRRVAFRTSTGRRFPEVEGTYYGRGTGGPISYTTLEAARVCGIVGYSEQLVDSIGLRYRELAEGSGAPRSRQFLLDMEPYLFPQDLHPLVEPTVRGVLAAAGWRTEDQLDEMSSADKQDTLITELLAHSKHTLAEIRAVGPAALPQKAAISALLMITGIRGKDWLSKHDLPAHREALIERIQAVTDEPLTTLRAQTDVELVRWGSAVVNAR